MYVVFAASNWHWGLLLGLPPALAMIFLAFVLGRGPGHRIALYLGAVIGATAVLGYVFARELVPQGWFQHSPYGPAAASAIVTGGVVLGMLIMHIVVLACRFAGHMIGGRLRRGELVN